MAGKTTIQQVMDALAVEVANIPELVAAHGTDIEVIQKTPTVIFSWFAEVDTTIETMSDQLWIANAKATLYYAPIRGNVLRPNIAGYAPLIHSIVDVINKPIHKYAWGTPMSLLDGVDRVSAIRVRPAEFGLEYAGHRFTGATIFIEIKLHRTNEDT